MPRTLAFGATGSDVVQLQQHLNRLPSKQVRLTPDGQFGGKTRGRVIELQSDVKLTADGVVGPMTWEKLLALLQQIGQGGVPIVPDLPSDAYAQLRPLVLMVAQQCMGKVDFSVMVGGRPKGLDFLIEMFRFAANVQLTDANFHPNNKPEWHWMPWTDLGKEGKSWCGVFAVYCYRKAGIPVSWNLGSGKPVGRIQLAGWTPDFASKIRAADIGCVQTKNHHFLIESVDGSGAMPGLTTIDGNLEYGRIERRTKHRVGTDNFNHYSLS